MSKMGEAKVNNNEKQETNCMKIHIYNKINRNKAK